jgi:DNA-binding response OmpR family regulator
MAEHVLVFNDTQEILHLFGEILTDAGYEVTLTTYGTEDLARVRSVRPQLIIADFPPLTREENGWQLVQKLKMARDTDHIPIIICTTNLRSIMDTQGWLTSKGIATLPKPFTVDELIHIVESQLRARQCGDST